MLHMVRVQVDKMTMHQFLGGVSSPRRPNKLVCFLVQKFLIFMIQAFTTTKTQSDFVILAKIRLGAFCLPMSNTLAYSDYSKKFCKVLMKN
jgi:hypothetical protein